MRTEIELEAAPLRGRDFAVRPKGCLGTCGWVQGLPWTVFYTKARSEQDAIRKARLRHFAKLLEVEDVE